MNPFEELRRTSKVRNGSLYLKMGAMLLLLLLAAGTTESQKKDPNVETRRPLAPESVSRATEQNLPPLQNPKEPVNCAVAGRYFDDAIARAFTTKDAYLLVIIRPGEGETSARLNEMRLLQVKAYLDYTTFSKYVIATGERVKDKPRIELYVVGKLLYVLPLNKNRGLNLLSCVAV